MLMFEEAKEQLKAAYKFAQIDDESWDLLQYPKRTVQCAIPMRHDDGSLKVYKAFRCQHNDQLGPYKGGVRYHLDADRDHCEALAFWMTFKCAACKIPYGGGKGSVCIDTKTLSHRELERISKAYIDAFADIIGPDSDILAPDFRTDERVMGWMYSEYRKIKGGHPKDCITGKPISLGGIEGRNSSTGYGGVFVLNTLLHEYGDKIPNLSDGSIAIQGYGKVGSWFADMAVRSGYKVVAISNEYGGTYDPKGLNLSKITKCQQETGGCEWGCGSLITNEELLGLKVDVLVPAAIEKVIHKDNVDKIKSKIILELANGPITNEADIALNEKGIFLIPDILANAGGVVVSYFEWVQNRGGVVKTLDEVNIDLNRIMTYATQKAMERCLEHHISLRTATYVLALRRIAMANECLGNRSYFRSRS